MKRPVVHPTAFIAPNAVLIGDVTVEAEASVWFGCVLRAEEAPIVIGPRTNVQDLTVVHTDAGKPCRLGAEVTVGHRAVLHGTMVEDRAFIGIGAILLNDSVVGKEAMIGAGAVVPEGAVIPPRVLAVGIPARVVRPLEERDLRRAREAVAWYVEQARAYRRREGNDE